MSFVHSFSLLSHKSLGNFGTAMAAASEGSQPDEWDALLETMLREEEEEQDQFFDFLCVSDAASSSQNPAPQAPRLWWARLLKEHTTFNMPDNFPKSPVTLVSGCSGIFSEAEVLKDSQQHMVLSDLVT